MPINKLQLHKVGISTSSNPLLSIIYKEVAFLELMSDPKARIRQLEKVMEWITTYLTSKPPQRFNKRNVSRWDALTDLVNQVANELKRLEAKPLTSPSDFRTISPANECYWLERLDPSHRPGFLLSELYQKWLSTADRKSFWEYSAAVGASEVLMLQTFAERIPYLVFTDGGRLRNVHDQTSSTQNCSTLFSGQGWGIFVVGIDGDLYVNSHVLGRFHHSSFFAGGAVAAAGEIVIDDGRIRLITAKTGHYRSGFPEMLRMINLLLDIPGDAAILWDYPRARAGEARFHTVEAFRAHGKDARVLTLPEMYRIIPHWCLNEHVYRELISKVPNPETPPLLRRLSTSDIFR